MKKNILKNSGVQSLLASLLCVVLGLLIGYVVLLFINPNGAGKVSGQHAGQDGTAAHVLSVHPVCL